MDEWVGGCAAPRSEATSRCNVGRAAYTAALVLLPLHCLCCMLRAGGARRGGGLPPLIHRGVGTHHLGTRRRSHAVSSHPRRWPACMPSVLACRARAALLRPAACCLLLPAGGRTPAALSHALSHQIIILPGPAPMPLQVRVQNGGHAAGHCLRHRRQAGRRLRRPPLPWHVQGACVLPEGCAALPAVVQVGLLMQVGSRFSWHMHARHSLGSCLTVF